MDSSSDSPKKPLVFFSDKESDNFLGRGWIQDEPNLDLLSLDFERSDLSLQFSNSSSPRIGKRSQSKTDYNEFAGNQPPFKVTKHVSKRLKCDNVSCEPSKSRNVNHRMEKLWTNSRESQSKDRCQMSKFFASGDYGKSIAADKEESCFDLSTAVGSGFESPLKLSLEEEAINQITRHDPLFNSRVRLMLSQQLPRTKNLFILLSAYFNNEDCTAPAAQIHQAFEYYIIGSVFAHLKIGFKSVHLDSQAKIAQLLAQRPNRPKKRLKMVQSILTQVINFMKSDFELRSDTRLLTKEQKHLAFLDYYFSDTGLTSESLISQYSITHNTKNRNVSYEFIEKLFRHPIFAEDFNRILDSVFPHQMKLIRMKRLADFCVSWESYLANSSEESHALEKIRDEMHDHRFHLPWTQSEMSLYCLYFRNLHRKLTET